MSSAPDLAPGTRLDRYEIIRRINRGGMATVWIARLLGEPPGSVKLFALKTILPELAGDPDMRAMFLDEANIASRIEHPNVARVFELGEAQGVLFQVMELVKGESLGHFQRGLAEKGKAFPMGVAMRICADACLGLHAAHEQTDPDGTFAGIVHRDVSPQNILLGRAGVAKVIDFGIAKAVNRGREETRAGLMKGKLRYMAPEQASRGTIDRRADVWSMGAVLYCLMNGAPPYAESGDVQILACLAKGIGPEPLPASVPAVVRGIVEKAMSFDPDDRYASTLEMAQALEAVMISTATTTTVEDVGVFCVANARRAGQPAPISGPTEPKPEPPVILEPTGGARRRTKLAILGGGLVLGVGAFFLLRRDAKDAAVDPPGDAAAEAPSVAPPPPSASTAPNAAHAAHAASADPVKLTRPRAPVHNRPKPRQKR
jgi:serine/threonine protein kinase